MSSYPGYLLRRLGQFVLVVFIGVNIGMSSRMRRRSTG